MSRQTFFCIDAHTCGNPVRVVVSGGPSLPGKSMAEKRLAFIQHYDWIRTGLMFEPRGHDLMSGSIPYPPTHPDADVALLFIETSGCLPMCGHGTIGTVTVLLEEGLLQPRRPGKVVLEVPAGLVEAHYHLEDGTVKWVKIVNVPSFLYARELTVVLPELGELKVDVAYGGNFYAIIEPQGKYTDLARLSVDDLLRFSPLVRQQLNEKQEVVHPEDPAIRGVSHIQWTGMPLHPRAHGRNAVFYGQRAIDRSPCGTGTSARMAQLAARGALEVGDEFIHESIIGSLFVGRVEKRTRVGNHPAIVPSIEGWARITGYNTIFLDSRDPYVHGFQVL